MSLETTMPPQYEHHWNTSSHFPLPDDSALDFSVFDEFSLSQSLNIDETFSFDASFLQDFPDPLADILDDTLGTSHGISGHDCMWAGVCLEDNKERPNPLDRVQESPVKAAPSAVPSESRLKDTEIVPSLSLTSVQPSSRLSSVKSNQRSLLRTNYNNLPSAATVVASDRTAASQDESDDSGRPETPQSMSSDVESADFKHDQTLQSSFVDEDDEENEETEEDEEDDDEDAHLDAVSASDATGQTVRTSLHQQHHESRASRYDSRPQQSVSNHFFNDHSYHLSKSDHPPIPGNLTPSDSEDEIDVVSVCGEKSSSRSSSQGALPSNPSARDCQALQRTMATAMKRSAYSSSSSSYPSYLAGRQPSGKLARMQAERQRQRERNKRRAQERDDSSEEDNVRPQKKRARHHQHHHHHHHAYKPARRGVHSFKSASSDSEPDSCEKRSLHNNMERQRRVDLRNAFEDLRVVVPKLSSNPRAAKVVILKEASHYCHHLTDEADSLQHETNVLERERERLLARVSHLRKQVASMRMGM